MTTITDQSWKYIGRMVAAALLFVALPFAPILGLAWLFNDPAPLVVRVGSLIWLPLGFYLAWRLAGRVVGRARYSCPRCSGRTARFEPSEEQKFLILVCPSCGLREKSEDLQFGE